VIIETDRKAVFKGNS